MEFSRFCGRVIFRVGAAAAVVGLFGVTPAQATYRPDARLDIVATPSTVTRSTAALATFASYKLTITSLDRDRLKKFTFKGTVSVEGSTEKAALFSAEGASCTLSDAGLLQCAVPGELASYGKTISFTVTLKTPTAGDAIKLSGKSTFFEYGCDWDYTNVATATTALTAPDPNALSTYVPASTTTAATLFSGTNVQSGVTGAIPIVDNTIDDPFTTTVIVPPGSPATTAAVVERDFLESCSANPRCFEAKLTCAGYCGRVANHKSSSRENLADGALVHRQVRTDGAGIRGPCDGNYQESGTVLLRKEPKWRRPSACSLTARRARSRPMASGAC